MIPWWLSGKEPPAKAGDTGDVVLPLGREDPLEEEKASHSSILAGNPIDRGAWRDTLHGVAESYTTEHTSTYKNFNYSETGQ